MYFKSNEKITPERFFSCIRSDNFSKLDRYDSGEVIDYAIHTDNMDLFNHWLTNASFFVEDGEGLIDRILARGSWKVLASLLNKYNRIGPLRDYISKGLREVSGLSAITLMEAALRDDIVFETVVRDIGIRRNRNLLSSTIEIYPWLVHLFLAKCKAHEQPVSKRQVMVLIQHVSDLGLEVPDNKGNTIQAPGWYSQYLCSRSMN